LRAISAGRLAQAVFVTHKKTGSLDETARFSNMVGGTAPT